MLTPKKSKLSSLALAGAAMLTLPAAALAQGTPDPTFNGRDAEFELTTGSTLRRGDRLTDTLVATVWTRMRVKGTGTCSANACPVMFNGEEVFARRTRLVLLSGGSKGTGAGGSNTAENGGRKLRRGDSGDDVRRLQEALNRDGARVKTDGNYGRGTEAAVSDYQRKRRLKVDGIAGAETLRSLGV